MRRKVCFVLALCACAAPLFAAERLQGPYPAFDPSALPAVPVDCGALPAPVVSLKANSKYRIGDAAHAEIDEAADASFRKTMAPVDSFASAVVHFANNARRNNEKAAGNAFCALDYLSGWAKAGALGDLQNKDAYNTQGKTLASLALAYLQIRDRGDLDPAERRVTETWLANLARALAAFIDQHADLPSSQNNHRYWSGLGVAAAGIAADDRKLFDWGMASARIGLAQVQTDGALPLEIARGPRARDYHLYALAPLVMLAELGRANGVDLYLENHGALKRLGDRVIASLDDPAFFLQATGQKQTAFPGVAIPAYRLGWLEAYQLRAPSPAGARWLAQERPVSMTGLGGNLTLLYAGDQTSPKR